MDSYLKELTDRLRLIPCGWNARILRDYLELFDYNDPQTQYARRIHKQWCRGELKDKAA